MTNPDHSLTPQYDPVATNRRPRQARFREIYGRNIENLPDESSPEVIFSEEIDRLGQLLFTIGVEHRHVAVAHRVDPRDPKYIARLHFTFAQKEMKCYLSAPEVAILIPYDSLSILHAMLSLRNDMYAQMGIVQLPAEPAFDQQKNPRLKRLTRVARYQPVPSLTQSLFLTNEDQQCFAAYTELIFNAQRALQEDEVNRQRAKRSESSPR